ncbi:hypothetical protein AVEN_223710-1 [Araneus ventricosus]|uniref:Uncharacterized protein n=1 Tax=Araneus ventricosus TaxID=182803 RepID=A0A4Y2THW6_ARAVE|nr:hypothetical protein AVEN_223710-1 [Araneus ventricosus]
MYALLEIITCCLLKNLLVSSALLWILCESRHLLGIGTRLGASSDGEFVHTYSTWTKGDVVRGYSDMSNDDFRPPQTPFFLPIFFFFFGFIFLLSCICFCFICKRRQRRLWANINANPSRPAFEIYPPVIQEEVRAPVGSNDVPPNYTAVVEPNTMAANHDDSLNHYPTVMGGKTLETPPPAYMTVAPFK